LYELKESGYVEQINFKGYKNIYDLALNEFGYEAAKVKYLIAIYLRFFNSFEGITKNNVTNVFRKNTYEDFSISQLRYMCEMTDEQLKKCSPDMTVKEIKDIKLSLATRVATSNVEKSTNSKNEIPGQNVITGVFPEKSDMEVEEKKETIIVSSLPNQPELKSKAKETKIVVEVNQQLDNNDSFEVKPDVDYETLYIIESQKYSESEKRIKNLTDISMGYRNLLRYVFEKLSSINGIQGNTEVNILKKEINEYLLNKKLPEKLNFMEKVI